MQMPCPGNYCLYAFDFFKGGPYYVGGGAPAAPAPADVDAYFLTSFNGPAWAALTQEEKDLALAEADRWLGTLCWDRTHDCCGRDYQQAVLAALAELALALHKDQTAVIGSTLTVTGAVKRQKLGDLEREFFPSANGAASRVGPNAPTILQRFPWLMDLIGCWVKVQGSSRVLSRC